MHDEATVELTKYLASLNKANPLAPGVPYDLTWEWFGADTNPYIRVYEQADDHTLCFGTTEDIMSAIREALEDWGLEDVVHYV